MRGANDGRRRPCCTTRNARRAARGSVDAADGGRPRGTATRTFTARQLNDSATRPPLRASLMRCTPLILHPWNVRRMAASGRDRSMLTPRFVVTWMESTMTRRRTKLKRTCATSSRYTSPDFSATVVTAQARNRWVTIHDARHHRAPTTSTARTTGAIITGRRITRSGGTSLRRGGTNLRRDGAILRRDGAILGQCPGGPPLRYQSKGRKET